MSFLNRWLKLRDRSDTPAQRASYRKRTKARSRGQLLLQQLEDRAVPAFGLNSLRLGATNGPTDYLYTTGNTIVPTGSVDHGKYYDIVVTDTNNVQRIVVGRTPASSFASTNNSYTILSTDPASTAAAWKFTLREYANATTATVQKSDTKSFYVAKAAIYSDAGLSVRQSNLQAGATAYVMVSGLQPGKSDWSATWYLPNGSTIAAANTAGGDRPDSNKAGVLAVGTTSTAAATYLQYDPRSANSGTDSWNWQSNYENKGSPNFQTFNSSNQGTWFLRLEKNNTHFVTLAVFTVDTTAPAAPIVTSPPSPVSINAPSYVISGTAEANALVRLWVDANNNGLRDAGEAMAGTQQLSGGATSFSINVPLTVDSANHFVATAADAAGNESPATGVPTITEDSSAPPAPTIATPGGPVLLNAAVYSIGGTAAAGSLVKIWMDANNNGLKDPGEGLAGSHQLAAGATVWAIPVSLTRNSANHFVVTASDNANNESAAATVPTITEDSTPPAPPIITAPLIPDSTNAITYTITGTAEANAFVQIWVDANNNGLKDATETTVAGSQQLTGGETHFLIEVPLTPTMTNNFVVTATDAAGNESLAADVLPITQQSDTPPPPIVTNPLATVVVNTATYTVGGTASAGTLVKIWRDNDGDGSVSTGDDLMSSQQLATGATAFAISVSLLPNADNNFLATATNTTNQNQSAAAGVPTISQDLVAPVAPSTPDLIDDSDSGLSQTDNLTNLATPTFTGTAEPDSTVTIYCDGVAVGSAAADSEGAWSVSTSALSDGSHSITARATDEASNTGPASASLNVVIDTAPPVVDAGGDQNVDEGTLVSLNGSFTDTPSNNGTPTPNWHLVNSSNGQTFGDGNGQNFSFTPNNNGSYTLRFTVTDAAGNVGSDDVVVTVDNVAPTVTLTGPASAVEGQTLHYTFTASDPGLDTFSVAANSGGVVGTVSNLVFNSSTGAGSFDVTFSNGPATSTVSIQLQDSDGALSNASSVHVAVDNVAPTVNLTGPADAYGGQMQHYVFTTGDPGADAFSVVVASGGVVGTVSNLLFDSNTGAGSFDVTFNTGPAVSTVSVQVQDSDGALSNLSTIDVSVTAVPPTVQSVQVDDGSAQRSRITELTVTFSTQVSFAGSAEQAFTLVRVSDGAAVTFTAIISTNANGQTVVRLTDFGGSATQFSSLADGRYTLTALADQISAGGSLLDGDGNGAPGGNFTFGDSQGLFRFFGDINGDRHVDIADFGQFSVSLFNPATYSAAFDFNGDGHIDIADFGQFSIRIFTVLP